jgi:hypothetical protein
MARIIAIIFNWQQIAPICYGVREQNEPKTMQYATQAIQYSSALPVITKPCEQKH